MKRFLVACGVVIGVVAVPLAGSASAHLHPFNPAAACAPEETGAGNESTAFFTAPGVQQHWEFVDLLPAPGVQFLVQQSNPGKAESSSGAAAFPAIVLGNPGVAQATSHCNQ